MPFMKSPSALAVKLMVVLMCIFAFTSEKALVAADESAVARLDPLTPARSRLVLAM